MHILHRTKLRVCKVKHFVKLSRLVGAGPSLALKGGGGLSP